MHDGDKVFGHLGPVYPAHIVAYGVLDVRRLLLSSSFNYCNTYAYTSLATSPQFRRYSFLVNVHSATAAHPAPDISVWGITP
jgi:hypothetical protein